MSVVAIKKERYLWYRLLVISVEDIGMGEPQAPVLLNTLYQINQNFGYRGGEYLLLVTHAVRYLCACQKDRASDEMINWIKHAVENDGRRHFWEIGAQLEPELAERDTTYRERMLKLIDEE